MDLSGLKVTSKGLKASYTSIPPLTFCLLGGRDSFGSCFENIVRHSRSRSILVSFRYAQDKNIANGTLPELIGWSAGRLVGSL